MRSGDMTTFLVLSYSGPLDYVHNRMTTLIRGFNGPAV